MSHSAHNVPTTRLGAALVTSASVLLALAMILMPIPGSQAQAASRCKIVVKGAHWSIRSHSGRISGNMYTIVAEDMSCYDGYFAVERFTHQKGTGLGQTLKGPRGFKCHSFSEPASGDKLVYSGVCLHPPHNMPFFEWGPKP